MKKLKKIAIYVGAGFCIFGVVAAAVSELKRRRNVKGYRLDEELSFDEYAPEFVECCHSAEDAFE